MDAFKVINNREHRKSSEKVYELHHEYPKSKDLNIFRITKVEDVRADIDVIGTLVKTCCLHKK
jgi:hypothetical protein